MHWPATARTGSVMIREFEGPRRPHVVIIADLRGPDPELVASRAAGMADDALRHGARVDLATAEVDGPRFGTVPSPSTSVDGSLAPWWSHAGHRLRSPTVRPCIIWVA